MHGPVRRLSSGWLVPLPEFDDMVILLSATKDITSDVRRMSPYVFCFFRSEVRQDVVIVAIPAQGRTCIGAYALDNPSLDKEWSNMHWIHISYAGMLEMQRI